MTQESCRTKIGVVCCAVLCFLLLVYVLWEARSGGDSPAKKRTRLPQWHRFIIEPTDTATAAQSHQRRHVVPATTADFRRLQRQAQFIPIKRSTCVYKQYVSSDIEYASTALSIPTVRLILPRQAGSKIPGTALVHSDGYENLTHLL